MHSIGILAHSADGAALCFLEMCRAAERRLGAHEHPEITLSILPMGPVLDAWERMDLATIVAYLGRTADRLAAAGCAFFVCPDNTAHIALEEPGTALPLPGLHIADIVAQRARTDARTRVGLLGTRWTMEGPVYARALSRAGIEMRVPPDAQRARVDAIIFDELCRGIMTTSSRDEYVRIIEGLRDDGCGAVILGCTEIPLLVTPEVSPLPTLDSTRLLAQEAVAVAAGDRPLPHWRGGPDM
ncbi:MAG: amino acid racemase [Polyangiaceae bacterium]|nr:amino acid racemase [Polyangiaceae bacterium]